MFIIHCSGDREISDSSYLHPSVIPHSAFNPGLKISKKQDPKELGGRRALRSPQPSAGEVALGCALWTRVLHDGPWHSAPKLNSDLG